MNASLPEQRTRVPFAGDRYQRLCHGVDVLAADPAVRDAEPPLDEAGIRALADAIVARRLFDHLDDHTADLVSGMLLIDFCGGPTQLAARITQLLDRANRGDERPSYDTLAIISGLAGVLSLMIDTSAWPPLKANQPVAPSERDLF